MNKIVYYDYMICKYSKCFRRFNYSTSCLKQWTEAPYFYHDSRTLRSILVALRSSVFSRCPILTLTAIFANYFGIAVLLVPKATATMVINSTHFIDHNWYFSQFRLQECSCFSSSLSTTESSKEHAVFMVMSVLCLQPQCLVMCVIVTPLYNEIQ